MLLSCSDSDAAIRALLEKHPGARDIEIEAAGLEQAFLALTGDPAEPVAARQRAPADPAEPDARGPRAPGDPADQERQ